MHGHVAVGVCHCERTLCTRTDLRRSLLSNRATLPSVEQWSGGGVDEPIGIEWGIATHAQQLAIDLVDLGRDGYLHLGNSVCEAQRRALSALGGVLGMVGSERLGEARQESRAGPGR